MRKPPATRGSGRRRWFDLHSWIGLKLCLLLGFICLTGTLAVFAAEIDWLLHPSIRVQPEAQRASWGRQLAVLQAAYPEWTLEGLQAPHASRFAARAQMKTGEGRLRHVWVDPYRGEVTGDTHWFNAHRLLRNTHRHLMLPVKYGVPLVAAFALPLLLSLVSSFFIYKRWWRGFFTWPRADRPRRLWGDVHRLAGVWSLAFIALMVLTGGWYLIESLGGRAPELRAVPLPQEQKHDPVPVDAAAVDRAIARLAQEWPAFELRGIRTSRDGRTVLLEGQAEAWLVRERANLVAFDLVTGTLLGQRDARELSLHQRISEMADPLHFGNFAGWPVRLVWFLFGALLTTLCFTGVYLYGLRIGDAFKAARKKAGVDASMALPGGWRLAWQGMRHWRWPWLLLLLTWLLLIPVELGR